MNYLSVNLSELNKLIKWVEVLMRSISKSINNVIQEIKEEVRNKYKGSPL